MANDLEHTWIRIASTADLEGREAIQVSVDGRAIAIFKIAGAFYATDAYCTHAAALLCDGYIDGEEVECPLHAGRFHIPTGKAVGAPAIIDLKTYQLKVAGSEILLSLQETKTA